MGQITDQIIEQFKERIVPWIQDLNDEIVNEVKDLEKDGRWPYQTVSSEYFLAATKQLLKAVNEVEKAYEKRF